jgi:TRAP-type mannitol/chloroaromatic compound transport system permease small subunit
MVLLTLLLVVLRYVFSEGAIALQEAVVYLHGTLFLLGIPYALQQDDHVRVDVLSSRLGARGRAIVDAVGHLLLLIPLCLTILYLSLPYVAASWRVLEGSSEVGGLPLVFLLKSLLPLMALLTLLQGLAETGRAFARFRELS